MLKHIFLAGIATVILAACAGPVAKGPKYAPIDAFDEYALVAELELKHLFESI